MKTGWTKGRKMNKIFSCSHTTHVSYSVTKDRKQCKENFHHSCLFKFEQKKHLINHKIPCQNPWKCGINCTNENEIIFLYFVNVCQATARQQMSFSFSSSLHNYFISCLLSQWGFMNLQRIMMFSCCVIHQLVIIFPFLF